MIRIYAKRDCYFCIKSKELLDTYNINYQYVVIGESISISEFKEIYPNVKTVPVIEVDGYKIGGYEQLAKYVEDTKNDYGHSI